jgi:hypothetical protein
MSGELAIFVVLVAVLAFTLGKALLWAWLDGQAMDAEIAASQDRLAEMRSHRGAEW